MKDNKKLIKYTSGITALALTLTLSTGCSDTSKFKLTQNENGKYTAEENSYIDDMYVSRYSVIEVYSQITNESKIYIAYRLHRYDRDGKTYHQYADVFNNTAIVYTNNEVNNSLIFIKETPLLDYLHSYNLLKYRYAKNI